MPYYHLGHPGGGQFLERLAGFMQTDAQRIAEGTKWSQTLFLVSRPIRAMISSSSSASRGWLLRPASMRRGQVGNAVGTREAEHGSQFVQRDFAVLSAEPGGGRSSDVRIAATGREPNDPYRSDHKPPRGWPPDRSRPVDQSPGSGGSDRTGPASSRSRARTPAPSPAPSRRRPSRNGEGGGLFRPALSTRHQLHYHGRR